MAKKLLLLSSVLLGLAILATTAQDLPDAAALLEQAELLMNSWQYEQVYRRWPT